MHGVKIKKNWIHQKKWEDRIFHPWKLVHTFLAREIGHILEFAHTDLLWRITWAVHGLYVVSTQFTMFNSDFCQFCENFFSLMIFNFLMIKMFFGKILYFLSDFPKKSDLCLSLTVFEFFLQMLHADQYTVRIYYDVKLVSEKYYDGNREFGRVRHSIVSSISQQFCLLRRDFCIYAWNLGSQFSMMWQPRKLLFKGLAVLLQICKRPNVSFITHCTFKIWSPKVRAIWALF